MDFRLILKAAAFIKEQKTKKKELLVGQRRKDPDSRGWDSNQRSLNGIYYYVCTLYYRFDHSAIRESNSLDVKCHISSWELPSRLFQIIIW